MYIRWVTRRHKSAHSTEVVFHDAYLVASHRDEQGRPRQRTLGYLGNMRQIDGAIPHVESELFLARAAQHLRRLEADEAVDAAEVLSMLREQLPALTPEAARHAFSSQISWFYHWWSQHGGTAPEDEIIRAVEEIIAGKREHAR